MADVPAAAVDNTNPPSSDGTFMYFAYGSNLLLMRIHIRNPTARRRDIGKLKDYRLDFNTQSQTWNGCSADVVEDVGSVVWGAIWEIDMSNLKDLDRQEGVERNLYRALTKTVETPTGELITCRLYQQVNGAEEKYRFEDMPFEQRPSRTYLNCILNGAVESRLPDEYIDILKTIQHNNRDATDLTLKQMCA